MVTKKDIAVAILATFCLTSTLFMIVPIQSQSGVGEYNPWADYNGDGIIDIFDIVPGAVSFGATSTDTTKNVNVTNWPQDRSLTVKKGIEKINIIDSMDGGDGNGYGLSLGKITEQGHWALFAYNFEPKGNLINVTEIYVNFIWRADIGGPSYPHSVYLVFWEDAPSGGNSDAINLSQSVGWPWDTMPVGNCYRVGAEQPSFLYSLIEPGINSIELNRFDQYGDHLYFFKLELFIEYYYLG